jgi:hypothetical protein
MLKISFSSAILAALALLSCINSGGLSACGDKTLEELRTQNTISPECKEALRSILPSSNNNVKGALVSLGSGTHGGVKTIFLGGTTPEGAPLPTPGPAQITVTAVTASGDSVLDTLRYTVKTMKEIGSARMSISVVSDYSGSMSDKDVADAAEIYRDLFTVLDTSGARFESSIYRFSDSVTLVSGFTDRADSLKIRVGVDGTYKRASTCLLDAIGTGILALSERSAAVKILVVTTDGFENSSRTHKSQGALYALARQHRVRVFMLGTLVSDLDFLRDMSRQSGGLFAYSGDILKLKDDMLMVDHLLAGALAVELPNLPAGTDSVRVRYGEKTVAFGF